MSGGGGSSNESSTTSKAELPPWLDQAAQNYVSAGQTVANRPYEAYSGQQIAGFTPDQANAFQGVRDMQGATGSALAGLGGQAASYANYQPQQVSTGYQPQQIQNTNYQAQQVNGGSLPGTDLSGYMNPYTQQVTNNALSALDQQRQGAQNQLASQAQAGNAYGGSRYALQAASTDAQAAQGAGTLAAQMYGQNFQNAQTMAQQDLARGLTAQQANQTAGLNANQQNIQAQQYNQQAGLTGNQQNITAQQANQQAGLTAANLGLNGLTLAGQMAQGAQKANYSDLSALGDVGSQLQGYNQQGLDLAQQHWQDARNYPLEQLGVMQSVMGSTPYGGTTITSGVSPSSKGNPAMGALGGAASGAATGSMVAPGWGTAAGAVIGGIGGYMGSR